MKTLYLVKTVGFGEFHVVAFDPKGAEIALIEALKTIPDIEPQSFDFKCTILDVSIVTSEFIHNKNRFGKLVIY